MRLFLAIVMLCSISAQAQAFCIMKTRFDWADKVTASLEYMLCEHNDLVDVVNHFLEDFGAEQAKSQSASIRVEALLAEVARQRDLIESLTERVISLEQSQ